ncbi:MAG: DsrE family protein [Campylobacterales bacterium]|nr:DsrE family protein [Campylobacterales bacterium]
MKIFKTVLFITLLSISLEAKEYKAVFDCSSGDADFIKSRMWLIGKTADMIKAKGDKSTFALTIHGKCTAITSKDYDMIVDEKDIEATKKAQEHLIKLIKEKDVKTTVCAMSLASNSIEEDSILESIKISPNSFLDTIEYQNSGYAIMTFK